MRIFRNTCRAFAAACLAVAAAGAARAQPALPADLGARVAEAYARPAFDRLREAAGRMEDALRAVCQAGAGDAAPRRAAASEAFGALARAWAGVEFLRFGPLVQGNRYERLAFWPDPRGVVLRQVQEALARRDQALLAPGALAARSVALQGLPALEFVLYRDDGLLQAGAAAPDAYACGYARAVAANVSTLSAELAQAWSARGDFGVQFTSPGPSRELYRNTQEVAAETVKALSTGLQFARDVKLLPVLGASAAEARPRRAAFWRSGQSVATLDAGLAGQQALAGLLARMLPADARWSGETARDEIGRARQALADAGAPIEQAAAESPGRPALALAALILKNAKDIVDQDLAAALGVTIGFNALDGD